MAIADTVNRFQLTRPMRGVTGWYKILDDSTNISTHTPHAGRDGGHCTLQYALPISTHTPHAGRDDKYV